LPRSPPESGASEAVRPVVAPPLNTTHRYESNVVDIYVLECEGGKFYVGKTTNGERRLKQHISGQGAEWTKMHKPKRIVDYYKNASDSDEKKVFEGMVKKHGASKVRGSYFTKRKASRKEIRTLEEKVGLGTSKKRTSTSKKTRSRKTTSSAKNSSKPKKPKSKYNFIATGYKEDEYGRIVPKTPSDYARGRPISPRRKKSPSKKKTSTASKKKATTTRKRKSTTKKASSASKKKSTSVGKRTSSKSKAVTSSKSRSSRSSKSSMRKYSGYRRR